jgi:hypothetical protein
MSSSTRQRAAISPLADGGSPPGLPTQAGEGEGEEGTLSYLQHNDLAPSSGKAIWSFWVKCGALKPTEKEWPEQLEVPDLQDMLKKKEFVFNGGSYHLTIAASGDPTFPPRIPIFPQREQGNTWLHNFVPFVCWGVAPEFKPTLWTVKVLEPDYYFYGPGGGFGKVVAQVPTDPEKYFEQQEAAKDKKAPQAVKDAASDAARGQSIQPDDEFDLCPPSMIGVRGDGKLRIILQTGTNAKYSGYVWNQSKMVRVHVLTPCGSREMWSPHLPEVTEWRDFDVNGECLTGKKRPDYRGEAIFYEDASTAECNQQPECFVLDPLVDMTDGNWHHILLSYDLGEGSGGGEKKEEEGPATGSPPGLPTQASAKDGGASVGTFDLAGDLGIGDIGKGIPSSGSGNAPIVAFAKGPVAEICHPGMYGQFTGPVPQEISLDPRISGAPFEDCGKAERYGYANDGEIKSACKAWLMVDGKEFKGKDLNFQPMIGDPLSGAEVVYREGKLGPNDIVPPNAWLALGGNAEGQAEAGIGEIRQNMVTSMTHWEYGYRTHLGGVTGPPAKIDTQTDEKRRLDYPRPRYEFTPNGLVGGPIAIPAGKILDDEYNCNIMMAELHIWNGKSKPVAEIYDLFKHPGRIMSMDKELGKPTIRLHWASNWMFGRNTGSSGPRKTGTASGIDPKEQERGRFDDKGDIDRYLPDPEDPDKSKK